jgi:hypothetical protein
MGTLESKNGQLEFEMMKGDTMTDEEAARLQARLDKMQVASRTK